MKTATIIALTAATSCWYGCGNQSTQEQAGQSAPQAGGDQATAEPPLPAWGPKLETYGFVSSEGAAWFTAHANETFEDPEDAGDYYDILGPGCSWYCGDGNPDTIVASSTLPDGGPYSYAADNAHDLRYDTAWVEGVEGPGIGEQLTYAFDNKKPRITKILIHTGYIKDEITWIKNNRVRALELSVNGKPTATLNLSDTRAEQSFDLEALGIGPLGRRADGKDLVLTFKILSVYPGTAYDDTAITEIYFDGIDVH